MTEAILPPLPRKPLSKRLRFEVFKRDGFACVYCGISPVGAALHVDHVIAVAAGGSNRPENLVTSCPDCNLGKSSVGLENRKLQTLTKDSVKRQREHAEQIAAFLENAKAIEAERDRVRGMLASHWQAAVGTLSLEMFDRLRYLLAQYPIPILMEAISITGRNMGTDGEDYKYSRAVKQQRYFSGVMRNWRENGRFGVPGYGK